MSYPRVVGFTYEQKYNQFLLQSRIHELMQSETPTSMEENDRELFIDFRTKPEGEFKIKIKNMKDRHPEVKKRVKPVDDDNLNVLMIFIDTLSRSNFHRKYRKTKKILGKYNYKNQASSRLYEYFRLHSIRSYTFPNLIASSYGITDETYDTMPKSYRKRITRYAQEKGYITGFGADYCSICEADLNKSKKKVKKVTKKRNFLPKNSSKVLNF